MLTRLGGNVRRFSFRGTGVQYTIRGERVHRLVCRLVGYKFRTTRCFIFFTLFLVDHCTVSVFVKVRGVGRFRRGLKPLLRVNVCGTRGVTLGVVGPHVGYYLLTRVTTRKRRLSLKFPILLVGLFRGQVNIVLTSIIRGRGFVVLRLTNRDFFCFLMGLFGVSLFIVAEGGG